MSLPLVEACRPKQWVKNGFVFAALFFSKHLSDPGSVIRSLEAFITFCLLSSTVYLVNDLCDLEADRAHPSKSRRPLASGRLGVSTARLAAVVLAGVGLLLAWTLGGVFFSVAVAYLLQNLAYSLWLKRIVILDVMLISCGFLLRAIGGAVALPVDISGWLVLCTVMLALFLGFTKRRQEIVVLGEDAHRHRVTLTSYNLPFLDQMISVVTASTVMSYALYTVSPEVVNKLQTTHMPLTLPFVLFGIFRYLFLVHVRSDGDNPTRVVLNDLPLKINIALWATTVGTILYWR
ncbi:MAG: decaprenyl-phosphate phosphoribosyltransferase [Candidatus Riflebacteria bacterium]|nr:decaprenyl-phosphate phosphoribosyltransferase [Candidatus Riflebacteria bacterium]